MRAVLCRTFGSPAVEDIPPPDLVPGGVRIAVQAAGMSFANLLVLQGTHQNRAPLPFIPGTEVAGIVTELAPDAAGGLRIGDRVCAGVASGGFAEQATPPDQNHRDSCVSRQGYQQTLAHLN